MAKALTYKDKVYRLDQEFNQKEYALTVSINKKYQWRIDKENDKQKRELERKIKQLQKKKKDKLHNLEVTHWKARGNAKVRAEKPKDTKYSDSCTIVQLLGKLKNSDKYGNAYCVCCPSIYLKWYEWDWGHYIPKWDSTYLALQIDNVDFQRKWCNSVPWWRTSHQRATKVKKLWEKRVKEMESQVKEAKQRKDIVFIRETLPILLAELEKKISLIGKSGKCMKQSYYKKIAIYQWKYM